MTSWMMLLIVSLCGWHTAAFAKPASSTPLLRHALLVSSNDGGHDRVQLRYAQRDVAAMAKVLAELGGIDAGNVIQVDQASLATVSAAVAELKERIAASSGHGRRQEVVFYYSGHSDEEGLLLGNERLSYPDLKRLVATLPVDVRLMILDSCASGQLTAAKGGVKRAPFLVDASVQTKGQAVITSASADEAAQESARIQGSFFTHYFISGLRGAADTNSDGRVTLAEAYQYAYANTLSRTETTSHGPQHPSYDFQLAGTGDLVLTDLRTSPASLQFAPTAAGRYFIRDASGNLVAELRKQAGQPVHLGLERGSYRIIRGEHGKYAEAQADLDSRSAVDVSSLAFKEMDGEPAVARGSDGPMADRDYKQKRFSFQLIPDFADDASEASEEHEYALGLLGGRSGKLDGVALAFGGYLVDEGGVNGAMIALGLNWDKGPLSGAQIAFANYARGPVHGAQLGWVDWANGSVSGAQIGLLTLASGRVNGAQIGDVAFSTGHVHGAQVGLVTVAKEGVDGAQVGMVDVASQVQGAQVGLATVAHSASVQVGMLNVASDDAGVQVGLVNYADHVDDFSLGLVSYAGNGTLDVETSLDEMDFVHASLRMGSRHLYTIYDVGARVGASGHQQTSGLGLGAHAAVGPLRLGLEMMWSNLHGEHLRGTEHDYQTLRALVGYELDSHLEVYGGPELGYYGRARDAALAETNHGKTWSRGQSTEWLGYNVGVRWRFKG